MASKKLNFGAILVSTIFILFANLQVLGGEKPNLSLGAKFGGALDAMSDTKTSGISFFGGIDLSFELPLDKEESTSIGLSIGIVHHFKGKFEQKWAYHVNEERLTTTLEPSICRVPVEIFIKQGLGERLSVQFAGGIDFYRASTDYSYSEIISGEVIPRQVEGIVDKGIGWHVALRPEVFLGKNKNFSLVFGIEFFSIGLHEFPPDENGNIREMRRFMGKDNNGIVYGPPPYIILPPGKPFLEYITFSLGGRLGLVSMKSPPTPTPTPLPPEPPVPISVDIDCEKIYFQVRTNKSECIGKRGAVPGGAAVEISFKGQTPVIGIARKNGSFRISCSRLTARKGDSVTVTATTVKGTSFPCEIMAK